MMILYRPRMALLLLAGAWCIALGLTVIAGWHLQQPVLVQLRPGYAPMAYNTALIFMFLGLGIVASTLGYGRSATVAGAATVAVAFITLMQHVFAVNFGIDELFMRHFVTTGMSAPGRMGPNTALSFILAGVSVILFNRRFKHTERRQLLIGLLSSVVIALGATALFGYMTGIEPIYGWAGLSPMALHTAAAFVVVGAALVRGTWHHEAPPRLPMLVLCGLVTATLILWQALVVHEQAQTRAMIRAQLLDIRREVESRLQTRIEALVALGERSQYPEDPFTPKEWQFETALNLKYFPGYQAIAWIDADLRVLRIARSPGNESIGGVRRARDLLQASRPQTVNIKRTAQSPTLNVYVPVFRDHRPQGFIVGVFQTQNLLDTILPDRIAPDFAIVIFDGEEQIYRRDAEEHSHRWAQTVNMDFYGVSWRLEASPSGMLISDANTFLPNLVLLGGLLLSGLLAWSMYLIRIARLRARQVEAMNRELNREIAEHERTAAALAQKTELIQLLLTAAMAANEARTVEDAVQVCIDRICTLRHWPLGHYFAVQDGRLRSTSIWCSAQERYKRFCHASETMVLTGTHSLPDQVLNSGKPAWGTDLAQQMQAPLASLAAELGLQTALAFPILIKTEVVGIFEFFSTETANPDAQLLEVMEQIGTQIGRVIERTRVDEMVRKLNADLERRVLERTHELETANRELQREVREREQAEENVAQEKERLAVTLQSIGDGVITTDTQGRVVLLNEVARNLTGWSQDQAYGRPLREIFPIFNERTREPLENPVQQVLKTGQRMQLENHTVLVARDGTERVIADSGAPIRDRDNRILGVVLVFRDVTAQKKMEADLLKAHKLESIGVLAGGIAHDFNNILTAILGNVALARMYANPGDKIYEALSEAEKAFWRARDLTQQLLTFAKGGAPVKRSGAIAEIVIDSARFALSGTPVRGEYHLPPDLWPVEYDPGQISQVINNLVINAVQAMPDGGVLYFAAENVVLDEPSLPLSPGQYVKLTIRDEGVGISSQHLSKIFDPYFTTKQKGSGLGLATAYSIIKRHDGHIQVESQMGVGTVFTIYLPAVHSEMMVEPPKRARKRQ